MLYGPPAHLLYSKCPRLNAGRSWAVSTSASNTPGRRGLNVEWWPVTTGSDVIDDEVGVVDVCHAGLRRDIYKKVQPWTVSYPS